MTVVQQQGPTWNRNFNPLVPTGWLWPTQAGVYEPLMIYNAAQAEWTPWLATGFVWEDETHLAFTIRDGVQWSDGHPFDARDVVFTFELIRDTPGLDIAGIWERIDRVEADGDVVRFTFERPYVPGLEAIAHRPIVAEHIFSAIDNPLQYTNPDPVGTGPFTEVDYFRPQVYQLGKNPYYWQPDRPKIQALRFPTVAGNDQAALELIRGNVDWAGNFIPAIDRIYVKKDPEHHHYWFPPLGNMTYLHPNHARPATGDVRVRKAISLAIDRQLVVDIGLHGYAPPADPSGLPEMYADWRDPEATAIGATWIGFDPDRANALLDEAGYPRGKRGTRVGPDGAPLHLEVMTVSGWSDWVRAAQVISTQLREVGIDAQLRSFDFAAYFDQLGKGEFDLAVGWSPEGPTPYALFESLLAQRMVQPVGTFTPVNFQRAGDPRMDALLDEFERTPDPAGQKALAHQMQRLVAEQAPSIPLFPAPSWGEFNSTRFVGFPTADDPYARLSPNHHPDPLLVMTRVRPRDTEVAWAPR